MKLRVPTIQPLCQKKKPAQLPHLLPPQLLLVAPPLPILILPPLLLHLQVMQEGDEYRITTIHQEQAPTSGDTAKPATDEMQKMEGMDHSQHQMAMPEMEKKS